MTQHPNEFGKPGALYLVEHIINNLGRELRFQEMKTVFGLLLLTVFFLNDAYYFSRFFHKS